METIKVLVVDDEVGIQDLFSQALEGEQYHVLAAADGKTALEAVTREQPRVVFLDLKLPDVDGVEVLKRIGQLDVKPIVIMITGHGTIVKAAKVMDLGAYDYIVKPFNVDDIIAVMEEALRMEGLERRVSSLRDRLKEKEEGSAT